MWITPFLARISNFLILAVPDDVVIVALFPSFVSVILDPSIEVRSVEPSFMASNRISLGTTCLRITFFKASLFSPFRSTSKNATFLGAKTVKEPSPIKVSVKPAFCAIWPNFFKENEGLTKAASRILRKDYGNIVARFNTEIE